MVLKNKYFLFALIFICQEGISQHLDPEININAPRIFPGTPTASALTRHSGAEVSLGTGMIQYNLPLWTFQCNDLVVPITASYTSGGVKVNDYPSSLGMTWVLNAGGVITRQLNCAIDETARRKRFDDSEYPFSQSNFNFVTSYYNLTWGSAYDTEPDLFSFQFGEYSGKFVLDSSGVPMLLPHSNLKIQTAFDRSDYTFCITTPKGEKYFFGGVQGTEKTYSNNSIYAGTLPHPVFVPTAYYLVKIVSIHGEVIDFLYDNYQFSLEPISILQGNNFLNALDNTTFDSCLTAPCPDRTFSMISYVEYRSKNLSEIRSSSHGRIEFSYKEYSLYNNQNIGNTNVIEKIKIYNNQNSLVRQLLMTYNFIETASYGNQNGAPSLSRRPFLTKIQSGQENYSFKYHNPELLPVFCSFAQDHWGYFNGQPNAYFISNESQPVFAVYQWAIANRNPYPAWAVSGLLSVITFPTGGVDSIIYEGNIAATGLTGGLRVQRIFTKPDLQEQIQQKRFYYAPLYDIHNLNLSGHSTIPILDKPMEQGGFCLLDGLPNYIPYIQKCLYTQRLSSAHNDLDIYSGYHIGYRYVTESFGGDHFENGGIEHSYIVRNNSYATPLINGHFTDAAPSITDVLNGREFYTRVIANNGQQLETVKETWKYYKNDIERVDKIIDGYKVRLRYAGPIHTPPHPSDFSGADVIKTMYHSQWVYLDSIIEKNYALGERSGVEDVRVYEYANPRHTLATSISSRSSSGKLLKTVFLYPDEKAATGNTARNIYNDMVDSNLISVVVEKQEWSNDSMIQLSRVQYDKWNGSLLLPTTIETGNNEQGLLPALTYKAYSAKARVLSYQTVAGHLTSVLYGYQQTLPVAEIFNAQHTSCAYSSFEHTDTGGWMYSQAPVSAGNGSVTGVYSFDLSGGSIQKNDLSAASSYVLTYWRKDDPSKYINLSATPVTSKNGWTLYQTIITGTQHITISGNAFIDELRLYPVDAQMKTFTYEPMIGITSECDTNNRITYYEYDFFGKLKLIRDQDRNIIKTFQYNYRNN